MSSSDSAPLKIPVKVTHLFVLFDLLRSVFLLKDVVDFDPGGLDFGSPSLTRLTIAFSVKVRVDRGRALFVPYHTNLIGNFDSVTLGG